MAAVNARDEFRWGVISFHNGLLNEAIVAFEKSLSYKPDDIRTRTWLGRAYYRAGFEESALSEWQSIVRAGKGSALLQSQLDAARTLRGLGRELKVADRYVISDEISGKTKDITLFIRPTSVRPRSDGFFYLTAFGSNEFLLFDTNGSLKQRYRGGLQGFDHPFDVLDTGNGSLYVSEYEGNRISLCTQDGVKKKTFGTEGKGKLLGPQFLAADGEGYIYVTDWGNRRICKFDEDGNFIFDFGTRSGPYPGLLGPTGILVYQGRIFVSDSLRKHIAVFDASGNFMAALGEGELNEPEGISRLQDGRLILADGTRVIAFDTDSEAIEVITDLEGTGKKIIHADFDANGTLLVSDFYANKVTFLTDMGSLYTGLNVQTMRIVADAFPQITVELNVKDRFGMPIIGLDMNNFALTENRAPVKDPKLIFRGNSSSRVDIVLLMDRSKEMYGQRGNIQLAVQGIIEALKGQGTVKVVSAGEKPVLEADASAGALKLAKAASDGGTYTDAWRFDLGARMAVSELMIGRNKKAVIFITQGVLADNTIGKFGLADIMSFMRNNNIGFYVVSTSQGAPGKELEYLCKETGGKIYYLFRPEGIRGIVRDIQESKSGDYVFTYTSGAETDFGRAYISVQAEAFVQKRSGRDELGYFAPLQY